MFFSKARRRWQFRLLTLFVVTATIAIPLAVYGNRLQRLRTQETAFRSIAKKGGTIYYSSTGVFVDFSQSETPAGMGVLCSNKRVICPDYTQLPTFSDMDLPVLENIVWLRSVDFSGSKVSKTAAFHFGDEHPDCCIGFDSIVFLPKSLKK
jgi:hypothetical protein